MEPGGENSQTGDAASGSTVLSPWYVAVDAGGDVYVSASVEGEAADVFKYDGDSWEEVGQLSTCLSGKR